MQLMAKFSYMLKGKDGLVLFDVFKNDKFDTFD